jgi:hypothetical protein
MFNYRRFALWLAVLLVPGGILLLPLLIAEMRRRSVSKVNTETPSNDPLPRLAA